MEQSLFQKRIIIILNIVTPFLLGTGIDLYVPSLPIITNYFHTTNHLAQLTVSLYMLGYSVGQLFLGVLSDGLGRKKILFLSAIFCTGVSFACVFSPNIEMLNVYRFLQGIGLAGLSVVCRAVLVDRFSGIQLNKAMTYISISWALGPILGPFIGGYLQHLFNWQADFYFFGLYGLMITVLAGMMPETHYHLQSLQPAHVVKTIRGILMHSVFFWGSIFLAFAYSALVMFNVIGPFLIQEVLKYSVVAYGHIALLLGIAYCLGNCTTRLAINYVSPMRVVFVSMIGAVMTSLCMLLLALFLPMNLWVILIPIFILFYFLGLAFPNMATKCYSLFPELGGTAGAVCGSLMALGVFMVTAFGALLETKTQTPLAIVYMGLSLVCLILFCVCQRMDQNDVNTNPRREIAIK